MSNLKLKHAPKTVKIDDGYLHFWYANNKGRGDDNCTIIFSDNPERASMSRNQKDIIAKTRTSSWNGHVNFSKRVRAFLGIGG